MGRLGSALLALGLLSGALAKPKVCFEPLCVPSFEYLLQYVGAALDLVPKTNESLDISLFFTPLVLSPPTLQQAD